MDNYITTVYKDSNGNVKVEWSDGVSAWYSKGRTLPAAAIEYVAGMTDDELEWSQM